MRQEDYIAWGALRREYRCRLSNGGRAVTFGMSETVTSLNVACMRRRLFTSSKGYIGLCPESCKDGNSIFILPLCPCPICLREINDLGGMAMGVYIALGHGYVHGLMNGEATHFGPSTKQILIV